MIIIVLLVFIHDLRMVLLYAGAIYRYNLTTTFTR